MKECWNDDSVSRPTFLGLKEELDRLISEEEGCNYLLLSSALAEEGCVDHAANSETTKAVESVFTAPQLIACSEYRTTEESKDPTTESIAWVQ